MTNTTYLAVLAVDLSKGNTEDISNLITRVEWACTNLAPLITKNDIENELEKTREQMMHGKIDPLTHMRYSITNAPGTIDPATGLPWSLYKN